MNLFENLQLMKESDTSIVSEFKEFLSNKNAQYIANEIGETKDGMQIVIYDGDWKHEHLYMKHLLDEFFTNKGIDISITSEEIGESDQDTFSARYDITFNAKSPEYSADVISEDVDTSNWKQRFKGMDVYISDKYPDYQIKKAYTSSKQEVWQVLNFKTQREVFVSSTFEGAIQWIENKSTSKQFETLDNMEESTNDSDWEFIEETTTNDEIFGDITEGGYYIKHYNDDMTGIIYPPSESEKLYRAKLTRKNKFNSFGSNVFIELDSAKEFLDTRAYELTSVTYEEIKQQLEEIDTHEYLKIFIDEPTKLGNVSVSIEGTLINGDPITFYDSSYIVNQRDIDFIKEQYAKASKQIDVMRERGYLGVKDESSQLDTIIAVEYTYDGDEVSDYKGNINVRTDDEEVALSAAEKYIKSTHPEINPRNFLISPNVYSNVAIIDVDGKKLTESNHNEILDKDYATGEELYNELVKYLNSLDQIAMDGKDCNWEPSEYNAKSLNADGEIYLVCGAYILIYPYVNEWAEDYFKVSVVESNELSTQLKNGIERIFNKFKTDKWQLIFEG